MARFADVVLVCAHFVVVFASTVTLLLIVVHCVLSLSHGCSLSLTYRCSLSVADALPLSHGCLSLTDAFLSRMLSLSPMLSFSLADALSLSLSRGCSLSHESSLSLSILWFVVVFTLVVFSFLTMASIWIDRAVVALRSFRPDLVVLLFVHDQDLCIVVL
jgi:hypothetical protein